jgi:hypothetical protein
LPCRRLLALLPRTLRVSSSTAGPSQANAMPHRCRCTPIATQGVYHAVWQSYMRGSNSPPRSVQKFPAAMDSALSDVSADPCPSRSRTDPYVRYNSACVRGLMGLLRRAMLCPHRPLESPPTRSPASSLDSTPVVLDGRILGEPLQRLMSLRTRSRIDDSLRRCARAKRTILTIVFFKE